METIKTLQVPTNSVSILQWKSDLQSIFTKNNLSFLINEEPEKTFSAQSELVLMGKNLTTTLLIALKSILVKYDVTQVILSNLGMVEGVSFIRFSLNKLNVELNDAIKLFSNEQSCDFALVPKLPDFSEPGLVLMDMDSTLSKLSVSMK